MKLRKVVFFAPQKYFKVEVKVAVVKLSQDRSFFFKVLLKMHEEQMCTGDSTFTMGRQGSYTLFSPFTIKMSSCTLDIIHSISHHL